ncbi:heavy-metal-associated domain-containing protein [Chaetomidium leptoderma]|uniref:Heavy-metal-associated domain-containing protein n=1 Tax=Chaetomidium leptoderma TaxID=669021 RepID=A0AAN6VCZ7_9PEZI|nr:heavy-metal-associated domain-containing protein [Chaetomidium leptoderma]
MADVAAPVIPAPDAAVAEHNYKFNVSMSCGGCSGAVERVLKKLEGVKSYEVSLDTQTATVVADEALPYEKVLQTIAKTGKKVNSGEADGVERSVEVPAAE